MKKWLMLVLTVVAVGLAGCSAGGQSSSSSSGSGSGSGSGGSGGSTATAPTLTLALSSTSITSAAPATASVVVTDSSGAKLSNVIVTFSVGSSIAVVSSSSALTDSNGVASVTLSPASTTSSGAGTLTASSTVNSKTGTASANFQVNSSSASVVSFAPSTGDSASDALSAYGQAVLTLTTSGASPTTPVNITITSACVAAGKATISPTTFAATSNTTAFTYKDSGGCGATLSSDTVTATVSGASGNATTQVFLTAPTANSITFSSATPSVIYLKGSGNVESSTVKFQVVDTAGNGLPNQTVTLNLSTFAGGLTLNQGSTAITQTSDANGYVSAIVNSGTVPTPVRVTAALASGASTVSSNLAVLTGLPTQTGFQLVPVGINIEGYNHVITNAYTVYASDRSQNPVPDSTSVLFWAEKGLITGTATTTNGVATTTLTTSDRPLDGRVTVLAYAIGEESFKDLHGTNVYQSDDPYQDLGNVVKSTSFDGQYNAATDEIISLSSLGGASGGSSCTTSFSLTTYPDFAFGATVPNQPDTCDGQWSSKTYVRHAVETVLSMDAANPLVDPALLDSSCTAYSTEDGPATIPASAVTVYPAASYATGALQNTTLYVGSGQSGSFSFLAADDNGYRINPMAAGSTITASPDSAMSAAAVNVTGGSYAYPVTSVAQGVTVNYTFGTTTTNNVTTVNQSGVVTVSFKSVGGLTTSVPFRLMRSAPPSTCP